MSAATFASRSPWHPDETVWSGAAATDAEVDSAIAGAVAAGAAWGLPTADATVRRAEALRAFAATLGMARSRIAELLVREAGKCRTDAEAEADQLPRKIAITLEQGLARTPALWSGPVAWRARGVAACIGPYNFPLHLLHGLVAPALAVGCAVVAKPSERCPALGELYRDLARAAGLGEVLRVVQGGAPVAARIARDPRIATVAAVGSRSMGLALAALVGQRPEAVLALELGGVNHALALDDADEAAAVDAVAEGAWRMAGQRCTATRVVHVPRARRDAWLQALTASRARWVPTGDPAGPSGLIIDARLREAFQAPYRALPAGVRLVAGDPRAGESPCAADPLLLAVEDPRARAEALYVEEHFGPALIVDAYDRLDECLPRMAANPYRLACAVHTRSRDRFRSCAERLPYGQVNWNRPTAGARSEMPFGGCGLSGNGRPAAVAACQIFADETVVWE